MSRQEELVRKGLIAEYEANIHRVERRIQGTQQSLRTAMSDAYGWDELDPDLIRESADMMAKEIEERQRLLAEIKRLKG